MHIHTHLRSDRAVGFSSIMMKNEKEAKMTQEAVLGVVVGRTDDVQLVRTPRPTQP